MVRRPAGRLPLLPGTPDRVAEPGAHRADLFFAVRREADLLLPGQGDRDGDDDALAVDGAHAWSVYEAN